MFWGVLAGLATGALWGLSYIAPRIAPPFSVWELTIVRYGFLGLISAITLATTKRGSWPERNVIRTALLLGAFAYVGFLGLSSFSILTAGGVIPALIVGCAPVVIPIFANFREKIIAWRALVVPLGCIGAGIVIVCLDQAQTTQGSASLSNLMLGTGAAILATLIWVAYSLVNARILQRPNPPSDILWTALQGIGAALASLILLPLTSEPFRALFSLPFDPGRWLQPDALNFWFWGAFLGIGGSWVPTILWSYASRLLPLALSAQLIVSETIFGLLFTFLLNRAGPSPIQIFGIGLQMVGVMIGIAVFSRRKAEDHAL